VLKEFSTIKIISFKHTIFEILIIVIWVTFIDGILCISFLFITSWSWIVLTTDTIWIIIRTIQIFVVFIVAIIITFMISIETLFEISIEFISIIMALHHWAPQNLVVPVVLIVTLTSNAYLVAIESTHAFTADSPILRTRISRFPTATESVFLSPRSARYHWQWS